MRKCLKKSDIYLSDPSIWFFDTTHIFFYIFTFMHLWRTRPFRKFNVQLPVWLWSFLVWATKLAWFISQYLRSIKFVECRHSMCWVAWRSSTLKVDYYDVYRFVLILSFLGKAPRLVWWLFWRNHSSTYEESKFDGYHIWDFSNSFQQVTDFEVSNKYLSDCESFFEKSGCKKFSSWDVDCFSRCDWCKFSMNKSSFFSKFSSRLERLFCFFF